MKCTDRTLGLGSKHDTQNRTGQNNVQHTVTDQGQKTTPHSIEVVLYWRENRCVEHFCLAGVPGAEALSKKLNTRLAQAKRDIPAFILQLPRGTYFTELGNLMCSEHKAIIQVNIARVVP